MNGNRAARAAMILGVGFSGTATRGDDWPMLGGRADRNMASVEKGLPVDWDEDGKVGGKNIKWVADLGQVTYGSPVVSGGRVFIGTNNDDPAFKGKRGILKC